MTVNYTYLALCLLLLWLPRNWLRFGMRLTGKQERQYNLSKPERDPLDRTPKPLVEASKSRNWVDLLRALAGSVGIIFFVFSNPDARPGVVDHHILGWQIGILFVAVLVQMMRFEGRFGLFAPIFFLQGLGLGAGGFRAGLFAMIAAWGLSPVLPSAGAILFVQGGLLLCFGLLLQEASPPQLLYLAGLTWFPVFFAVLLQKRLPGVMDKRFKVVPRSEATARRSERASEA